MSLQNSLPSLVRAAKSRVQAAVGSADIDKLVNSTQLGLTEEGASALRVSLKKNLGFISKELVSMNPPSSSAGSTSDPSLDLVFTKKRALDAEFALGIGKLMSDVNNASVKGQTSWFRAEFNMARATVLIYLP